MITNKSCKGFKATTIWIVWQLGLATIPGTVSSVKASPLTSGTIKGIVLSFLKHEELSTTKHPLFTALGAYSLATSDPAEKNAKSILEKSKSSKALTT